MAADEGGGLMSGGRVGAPVRVAKLRDCETLDACDDETEPSDDANTCISPPPRIRVSKCCLNTSGQ